MDDATILVDNRRYLWSLGNEIVLRDTVSQLCFAMKFTKDKREIPWDPFKGKEYSDETLGAVRWTDSVKMVEDKRDKTVFADRAARIGTIRALSENMAQEALRLKTRTHLRNVIISFIILKCVTRVRLKK